MAHLEIPTARREGVLGIVRAAWTAPTTQIGHIVANLAGCPRAERIAGARAYVYRLPPGRFRGLGAIAIGHVIIVEPSFVAGRESWILAHELSHTRQHDWLGPAYLPVHALFQLVSVAVAIIRPVAGFPPQHAYNPLERVFLCVPFDVLAEHALPSGADAQKVLRAFGLSEVADFSG